MIVKIEPLDRGGFRIVRRVTVRRASRWRERARVKAGLHSGLLRGKPDTISWLLLRIGRTTAEELLLIPCQSKQWVQLEDAEEKKKLMM